ncbi:MAG TPA: response regulator [Candidatus Moranbacteria bacterium]|nr:response regulator [Candidatus Moranbacteria bacterium]
MPRIIIAEDDPMIADIYHKKFTDFGFDVAMAETGDQVLTLAKKERPDVVLLDLVIPKMNGFEVIKALRGGNFDKDIKIIVFSNLNQPEDRKKASDLGADEYLIKAEYTPGDLVKEISRILHQHREEVKNEEKIAKNGDQGYSATKNGKKILFMEDEEVFQEMFGEKLKQDGYEVTPATNGAWGIKEAMLGNYDLFLIDMIMPAMTGEEIVAKIKLEEKIKDTPIVVLSASVDEKTKKKVEAMGVNKFFVKTQIIPSDLSEEISKILND